LVPVLAYAALVQRVPGNAGASPGIKLAPSRN
jgi:hypothetical protein